MKVLIASDLHGSFYYVNRLVEKFNSENYQKLILLGDILYHGPRNDLPRDYNPQKVISLLNPLKNEIICVKGNCDAEVDQMVLDFKLFGNYKKIKLDNLTLFLTHGHKYNQNAPLPLAKPGDVVLFGHSHLPFDKEINGVRYINPGSVSIPKQDSKNSCLSYSNGIFTPLYLD